MKPYIEARVLEVANYVLNTKATIRKAAGVFKVSKSTIHKDLTQRLPELNPSLTDQVQKVLNFNRAERYYRGGESTKQKYLKM